MSREHQRQSDERLVWKSLHSDHQNLRRLHDADKHRFYGGSHEHFACKPHSSAHVRQRLVNLVGRHDYRPHDNTDCRQSGTFKSNRNDFDTRSNRLHRRKRRCRHGHEHLEYRPRRGYVRSVGQRNFARHRGNRQYDFAERYLRERLHVLDNFLRYRHSQRASTRQSSRTVLRLLQDSALHGIQPRRLSRRVRFALVPVLTNKSNRTYDSI